MLICSNENLIYNIYLLIYKAVCIKHIIYQHSTFVLQSGGHYTMKRQPLVAVWYYLPMLLFRG